MFCEDKELIEAAVNIPNRNFIDKLPNDIVVEVPAIINGNGARVSPCNTPANISKNSLSPSGESTLANVLVYSTCIANTVSLDFLI